MNRSGMLRVVLASGLGGAAAGLFAPMLAPVAFIALLITLSPLARRKRVWFVGDVENEFALINRRREEALRALKDLQDDRDSGKISAAEFERARPALLESAKDLTARMDALQTRRTAARKKLDQELADSGTA